MTEERTVQDSIVETVHLIRPNHMNAAGRLFGGMLMQWLDEVAGLVAKRHSRSNIITASVDNLRFIHGAYNGEMVVIIGKVTYARLAVSTEQEKAEWEAAEKRRRMRIQRKTEGF